MGTPDVTKLDSYKKMNMESQKRRSSLIAIKPLLIKENNFTTRSIFVLSLNSDNIMDHAG